jgi:hypothetical protein
MFAMLQNLVATTWAPALRCRHPGAGVPEAGIPGVGIAGAAFQPAALRAPARSPQEHVLSGATGARLPPIIAGETPPRTGGSLRGEPI